MNGVDRCASRPPFDSGAPSQRHRGPGGAPGSSAAAHPHTRRASNIKTQEHQLQPTRDEMAALVGGENVVVIDHDDDIIRAGYANPEKDPAVITPALVRRAGAPRGAAETLRPIVGRNVVDWDQLEAIYAHVLYRQLAWVEGEEGAALITEPLFTSKVGPRSHPPSHKVPPPPHGVPVHTLTSSSSQSTRSTMTTSS